MGFFTTLNAMNFDKDYLITEIVYHIHVNKNITVNYSGYHEQVTLICKHTISDRNRNIRVRKTATKLVQINF